MGQVSVSSLGLCLLFCITAVQSCRSGWTSYGRYCYLFKPEGYTFFEAKVTCDIFGSYLAEIHSAEENAFLASLIRNANVGDAAWIGLEDLELEGRFLWSGSGRVPDYLNWLSTDPNDALNNEDCVTTRRDGFWQDDNCDAVRSFICQMDFGFPSDRDQYV